MRILLMFLLLHSALGAALTGANYLLEPEAVASFSLKDIEYSGGIISGEGGAGYQGEPVSVSYKLKQGFFNTIHPDLSEPLPLSRLNSSTDSDGNILLSWSGASDSESWINCYRIYRAPGEDGIYKPAGETEGTAFTDSTGLIYGISYCYKVVPVDAGGNASAGENPVSKAFSASFATSVTSLAAVPKQGGGVALSWREPAGASYYRIYRSNTQGEKGSSICADGSISSAPYLDSVSGGLVNGTRYYYTVQYVDGFGNEQRKGNNQADAPCDSDAPSEAKPFSDTHPAGVTVENNSPEFHWNESIDPNFTSGGAAGIKGYRLFLGKTGGLSYSANWELVEGFRKEFSNLDDGDWYFYISAEDLAGNFRPPSVYKISILTKGEISGKLTGADGKSPLGFVNVELLKGSERLALVRTGADGAFTFSAIPFGSYCLRVLIPGSAPWLTEELSVSKDSPKVLKRCSVASVPVVASGEVTAYPNPVRGAGITFVYPSESGSMIYIDIFDQAGRRIQSISGLQSVGPMGETTCGIEALKSGVYFYVIRSTSSSAINRKYAPKAFTVVKR